MNLPINPFATKFQKTFTITFVFIFFALNFSQSQTLNEEIDSETDATFLLGRIDKNGLTSTNYNSWFSENFENYQLDESVIEDISKTLKDYTITVFMGTWCGDSKQEVPRFYKILEACNFPIQQLTVIAVNRKPYMYKQSPNHEESGLNIHRVPTIIFYKNRKEVNRIVEHPVETLEKDILKIISANNYIPNYQIVEKINAILKYEGLNGLKSNMINLSKTYENKVTSISELNTYGYVLYSNNYIEEAIEVFKLNTQLFPKEPNTYMSLANTLGVFGEQKQAIEVLEKSLTIFPDNNALKENLQAIKTN